MKQKQFLKLATAEEAYRRFVEEIKPAPLGEEEVALEEALHRILSRDVISKLNVPFFDRSSFDGFAVRAEDTFGAEETSPILLKLNNESLACGVLPTIALKKGTLTSIATGGVLPRGANGVVMLEKTLADGQGIQILKPITPGEGVLFAGSDIGAEETVLRKGERLSSRETGVLAAIGETEIWVWKKPRVGIISTGNEIIAPGSPMSVGKVYDSNAVILADSLREIGCEPFHFGIVADDVNLLEATLLEALGMDFVLISGGTSKGEGDLNYSVIEKMGNPGILVHGVALKPGKPLCLASVNGVPTAVLPGFPTSAIFTFTKFIAPVLRSMAGAAEDQHDKVMAVLPMKFNSQKGRTEFDMVNLVKSKGGYTAYSMGKGSGSITTFAKADGFIEIPRQTEMLEAGDQVEVLMLGKSMRLADLMIIGSHCIGLDYLIGLLQQEKVYCKFISVGSMGGVMAAKRGECDIAGSHLMDEKSEQYNDHLLNEDQVLIKGYKRSQGILFRKDDSRFSELSDEFNGSISDILNNCEIRMINRNRGSGTRVLLDQILNETRPPGYFSEAKSHNAVAAAIAQGRADWGMAIHSVARELDLGFIHRQDEEYDFIIPKERLQKPAVKIFLEILDRPATREGLKKMGLVR
ncbi:MAG: molybdopterin biosynthesis protein [SAR324 cluster bacterium]|nr:molybdopterin biosynthesis protein [SAR324 cluster bacterium]